MRREAEIDLVDARLPRVAVVPQFAGLPRARLVSMHAAAAEVFECRRVLRRGALNIVGEALRGQDAFVEYDHYPRDDVYDADSGAQYYYHAHRGVEGEHGHFHTFMRSGGMPEGLAPLDTAWTASWPSGMDAISHLIAISMDAWGEPVGLFTTNRWVTGDTWYPAGEVSRMLDGFRIDHASPSWPMNRWLGAMLIMYRPHIEALLIERDQALAGWLDAFPGQDVFERRDLEIASFMRIDPAHTAREIDLALKSPAREQESIHDTPGT